MGDSSQFYPKPIPEELHSEYEERPFRSCTRCGESLLDFAEGFHVAKLFKGGETIFEYALCVPCHSGLIEEFSSESKRSLEDYYAKNMKPNLGLDGCGLCGIIKDALAELEYALGALCHGTEIFEGFLICSPCMEQTNSLISKKTQGVWGDFIDENFPGVPANALPAPGKLGVL